MKRQNKFISRLACSDVIISVFQMLDMQEQIRMQKVCRLWYELKVPLAMDIFPMKKPVNIQIFLCMDESKTMLDVQWQTQVIECRIFLQQVSLHLRKFYTTESTVNVQIMKYGINNNFAFQG